MRHQFRLESLQFVTLAERHKGIDKEILAKRTAVYEASRQEHPERWTRNIRNWEYSEGEGLNPRQVNEDEREAKAS